MDFDLKQWGVATLSVLASFALGAFVCYKGVHVGATIGKDSE